MRSKSPLALMEQVVMVLVFALAAALCIQVFVFSDQRGWIHVAHFFNIRFRGVSDPLGRGIRHPNDVDDRIRQSQ